MGGGGWEPAVDGEGSGGRMASDVGGGGEGLEGEQIANWLLAEWR